MKTKVFKMSEAVQIAKDYGFTDVCTRCDSKADRLVTMHQTWWPSGRECIVMPLARGKYRGNNHAFAVRPESE